MNQAQGSENPWACDPAEVLVRLGVDPQLGLTAAQVQQRRARHGWNRLQTTRVRSLPALIAAQFRSVVVLLLLAAGALAFAFSDHAEGLAIFAVIAINGAIGFLTEWRATRSMEALSRLGHMDTIVLRDGLAQKLSAEELVPGDIVLFEGGDVVTADVRLLEAARLQADESALTGESLPVHKQVAALPADTPVMERGNSLFKGTAITRGSARAVVVGTGQDTELGRISTLVTGAKPQQTPLEKQLDLLGGRLAWAVIGLAIVIAGVGVAHGRDLLLSIKVAVALAVAAIPEGLPIVATIALARGLWRMARRNAVISRLSAVETLGATSVIFTDKTGTLTENRMAVVAIWLPDEEILLDESGGVLAGSSTQVTRLVDAALTTAALCANASVQALPQGGIEGVGDPTEVALLEAALRHGLARSELLRSLPELDELPFDPDTRRMATLHQCADGVLFAVKGAPEVMVPLAGSERTLAGEVSLDAARREAWLTAARDFGKRGLRTLALAAKTGGRRNDPWSGLVLQAIVGLEDPPRAGVRQALERCQDAGVKVVMVTGDHAATACHIADHLGLFGDAPAGCVDGPELGSLLRNATPRDLPAARVYSRVSPEQKLRLIQLYQQAGKVVAMTGDGVNDAPALKQADIGVAMGIRGTAVAREAAAMVLRDDQFGTIVEAIAQGRAIHENIRKFCVYLLSCNMSELLVVTLATVAGAPLPLLPLQILFLNLVTDVFPALALGVGEGAPGLMRRAPRPAGEPLLTRAHWWRIVLHGVGIAVTVLAAMAMAVLWLGFDTDRAVSVSFCTLALAQLWHVFNMRDQLRQVIDNEITRNVFVWLAITLCLGLVLAAVYIPLFAGVLQLADPGPQGWLLIVTMSLLPLLWAPLVRGVANRPES